MKHLLPEHNPRLFWIQPLKNIQTLRKFKKWSIPKPISRTHPNKLCQTLIKEVNLRQWTSSNFIKSSKTLLTLKILNKCLGQRASKPKSLNWRWNHNSPFQNNISRNPQLILGRPISKLCQTIPQTEIIQIFRECQTQSVQNLKRRLKWVRFTARITILCWLMF